MPPSKQLLIVDEDKAFVEGIGDRFRIRLFKVFTAHTAQEALIRVYEHPDIEVVLLNVKLPGVDGIDALREIKKVYPLVEVIMLANQTGIGLAVEGMRLGAFDYVLKPPDFAEVLAKVDEATSRGRKHRDKIRAAEEQQERTAGSLRAGGTGTDRSPAV